MSTRCLLHHLSQRVQCNLVLWRTRQFSYCLFRATCHHLNRCLLQYRCTRLFIIIHVADLEIVMPIFYPVLCTVSEYQSTVLLLWSIENTYIYRQLWHCISSGKNYIKFFILDGIFRYKILHLFIIHTLYIYFVPKDGTIPVVLKQSEIKTKTEKQIIDLIWLWEIKTIAEHWLMI